MLARKEEDGDDEPPKTVVLTSTVLFTAYCRLQRLFWSGLELSVEGEGLEG